jgi:hypothetical protein
MDSRDPVDDLKDRPLADLLKQLSQETAALVRRELELAKAEVSQKGKTAGMGVGIVGAASVVALLALGALTACFILALNAVMPAWLAALIVAVIYGGVAAFLGLRGKEKVKELTPPAPQTVETVKEDVQWARNPTKSPRDRRDRARMGETAEAIAYKADVKARAKESVVSKRAAAVSSVRNVKDSVVGAIAGTGESMADAMENMRHSTVSSVQHRTPTTDEVRQGARSAVVLHRRIRLASRLDPSRLASLPECCCPRRG